MNQTIEYLTPAARLAQSRAELRQLFDPVSGAESGKWQPDAEGQFPRSATMKLLMNNGVTVSATLLAFGLLALRPAMAGRWLRYLPIGTIVKMFAARLVGKQFSGAK